MNLPSVNSLPALEGPGTDETRRDVPRNPGADFDEALVSGMHVDEDAAVQRAQALAAAHVIPEDRRAAWLMRAVSCLDLTTLKGDDTEDRVRRLCARAHRPLSPALIEALGAAPGLTTGAVCVHPALIATARAALAGTDIPVASVAAGFPAGLSLLAIRVQEVGACVAAGADEVDIVIRRGHVLGGNWKALYEEVKAFRAASGDAHLKAILATGELGSLTNVARASLACILAGADFIKTSTGMEAVNATLPASLVMVRTIREHFQKTGLCVGFKPAGGISTVDAALGYMALVREELGPSWLNARLFRIGASRLLDAIEEELAVCAA